jgi:hypothetical protein
MMQKSTEQNMYVSQPRISTCTGKFICKRCEGRQKFIQVRGFAAANTQQQIRKDGAKEG